MIATRIIPRIYLQPESATTNIYFRPILLQGYISNELATLKICFTPELATTMICLTLKLATLKIRFTSELSATMIYPAPQYDKDIYFITPHPAISHRTQ